MQPQIVAFDIETTNLRGNFGRILCASFLNIYNGNPIVLRGDSKYYIGKKKSDDSKILLEIKKRLERAWMWVTWNGKCFDIPFVNGRLSLIGVPPIEKRLHLDLMWYASDNTIKFGSKRLANIAESFKLREQKFSLEKQEWIDAILLDRQAMNSLVRHNIQDVKVLQEVFPILAPFICNIHK